MWPPPSQHFHPSELSMFYLFIQIESKITHFPPELRHGVKDKSITAFLLHLPVSVGLG